MKHKLRKVLCFLVVGILAISLTACQGKDKAETKESAKGDKPYAGQTINVLLPPWYEKGITAAIPDFEQKTGIKVKLEIMEWDPLKDKIVTAASSNTAAADVTEFSWDWVGSFGAAGWYEPLNKYLGDDFWADSMTKDSFKYKDNYLAVPIYNDFRMTYVNTADFNKAGVKDVPTDAFELLEAAKKIKASGAEKYPISLPLSATAGTTTPWFMLTKSLGGELFDENYKPLFTQKDSAGYKAMDWIMKGLKEGLINPAAVDYQGTDVVDHFKNNQGSIDIAGWSGNITEYFNKEKSKISSEVKVIKVPGNKTETHTYSLIEGVGIPAASKHKEAAAEFIKYINTEKFVTSFFKDYGIFPSSKKVIDTLVKSGDIPGGEVVSEVIKTVQPLFPQGAPKWYSTWEGEVGTIMNQMAKGKLSMDEGLKKIADSAEKLNK